MIERAAGHLDGADAVALAWLRPEGRSWCRSGLEQRVDDGTWRPRRSATVSTSWATVFMKVFVQPGREAQVAGDGLRAVGQVLEAVVGAGQGAHHERVLVAVAVLRRRVRRRPAP